MLTATLLKPFDALLSVLLYLVIGIIGLPVFSGLSSGLGVILGPTGGFLLSFPLAAYLMSLFNKKTSIFRLLIINIIFGIIFVYIIGIAFISIYTNKTYIDAAISMLIFIPIDLGKATIAAIVSHKMQSLPIMLED
jgi:biotin transport system substrate-specific component